MQWYCSTRDNYLSYLHKFANFIISRDTSSYAPFVFPPSVLLAFVDELLQRRPTGDGQLKVSTALDQLAGIKSCFLQAGYSFAWPPAAYRLVKSERTSRRQQGLERPLAKAPFMPRVA